MEMKIDDEGIWQNLPRITSTFRWPLWSILIVWWIIGTILVRSPVVTEEACKDIARDHVRSLGTATDEAAVLRSGICDGDDNEGEKKLHDREDERYSLMLLFVERTNLLLHSICLLIYGTLISSLVSVFRVYFLKGFSDLLYVITSNIFKWPVRLFSVNKPRKKRKKRQTVSSTLQKRDLTLLEFFMSCCMQFCLPNELGVSTYTRFSHHSHIRRRTWQSSSLERKPHVRLNISCYHSRIRDRSQ